MSRDPVDKLPFVSTVKSDLAFRCVGDKKYWLSNHGVHSLIYPNWDINTLTTGKTPSSVFSNRDTWFFNMEKTNILYQNWATGFEKLWQTLPDYWKNDPADVSKGIKGCLSKSYFLEKEK